MYVCWRVEVHCCFTSTETIKTVRDREPRMATSTSTQLLSCVTAIYTICTYPYLYDSLVQTLKLFCCMVSVFKSLHVVGWQKEDQHLAGHHRRNAVVGLSTPVHFRCCRAGGLRVVETGGNETAGVLCW